MLTSEFEFRHRYYNQKFTKNWVTCHMNRKTQKRFLKVIKLFNNYKNTITSGDENYVSFGLRALPKNENNVTLFRYYRKL